jgi:hypothetical protein
MWVSSNHNQEIRRLLEEDMYNSIYYAIIKFKNGGQLGVKYPKNENLKEVTIHF